jgi:hypothetical protein
VCGITPDDVNMCHTWSKMCCVEVATSSALTSCKGTLFMGGHIGAETACGWE